MSKHFSALQAGKLTLLSHILVRVSFLFVALVSSGTYAQTRTVQFHIDLNGTLVIPMTRNELRPGEGAWFGDSPAKNNQVIYEASGKYRVVDGAGEFIASLLAISENHPNLLVEVFINTNSQESQVKSILNKIYVPGTGGRSALDLLRNAEGNLRLISRSPGASNDQKDLRTSRRDGKIQDSIYVGDRSSPSDRPLVEGQETHWLELDMLPIFTNKKNQPTRFLEDGRDLGIDPKNQLEDISDPDLREAANRLLQRKRGLEYARGLIELAIERIQENSTLSLSEVVHELQSRSDGLEEDFLRKESLSKAGSEKFRSINENYKSPGLFPPTLTCTRTLKNLVKQFGQSWGL